MVGICGYGFVRGPCRYRLNSETTEQFDSDCRKAKAINFN